MGAGSTADPQPALYCSPMGAEARPTAASSARWTELPGWELVGPGITDLEEGRASIEAWLVACAVSALRDVGLRVPDPSAQDPETELYRLVEADVGDAAAHARYNALRRRLASFLRAARLSAR